MQVPAKNDQHKPRVFLVEDDEAVRESLLLALRRRGYKITGFASPALFLGEADMSNCDCIIVDLHLPVMNGLELLELLRKRAITIPALMITGRMDQALEARIERAGVAAVLSKPFPLREIDAQLQRIIAAPSRQTALRT